MNNNLLTFFIVIILLIYLIKPNEILMKMIT